MSELNTFIPAGGIGSRLHPHSFERPKPLFVMGESHRRIIDWPVELALTESSRVLVSTDYLGEQVTDYLAGMQRVTTLRDEATIGSGGSLLKHYAELDDVDPEGDTLILPSDHIYENLSLAAFRLKHREDQADITLLTVPQKDYGEFVGITDDTPTEILTNSEPGSFSTTGIFMLSNRFLLNQVARARSDGSIEAGYNIYHDLICPAVGKYGVSHFFMDQPGFWEDTGTTTRYHRSNMRISGGETVIASTAFVHPDASINTSVVLDHTVIDSPLEIENAIVSTSAEGELIITRV